MIRLFNGMHQVCLSDEYRDMQKKYNLTKEKVYNIQSSHIFIVNWIISKVGQVCQNFLLAFWKKNQDRLSFYKVMDLRQLLFDQILFNIN